MRTDLGQQSKQTASSGIRSWWVKAGAVVLTALLISWAAGSWLLWVRFDELQISAVRSEWPFASGKRQITVEELPEEGKNGKTYNLSVVRGDGSVTMEFDIPGKDFSPLQLWTAENSLHLVSVSKGWEFWAKNADVAEIGNAVTELAEHFPKLSFKERILAAVALHPCITGLRWGEHGPVWRISTSRGTLWIGRDPLPEETNLRIDGWQMRISSSATEGVSPITEDLVSEEVPGDELSASLAEAIRMAGSQIETAETKPDAVRQSGAGWLQVRDGHTQMYLEGSPYEIGHQHGRLDPEGVRRNARRVAYGVGLLYSLEKGEWFPTAARKLVERQRPFIAPAYFEEMKGLADGAGLPIDLVQMTNIFPEFFHCSGVALMGKATEGGELLHARVLDYMVGIGLQDNAAVMAIAKTGAIRFVTVGFLGFIGSVTGMNESQVSIGEMGGKGQGNWDGIPMSLLIRQALETCNTLEEVETFMRESPRTCEYYYVIADGKGPSAVGVAATPEKFEAFGPGVWNEQLTQPIADAVLVSGSGRYEKLVERVRSDYGKITRDDLIEIIKRPVAMQSNLHNVIFQPQSLRLSVADATRDAPACDQPYRTYGWDELFSAAPPR